MKKILFLGLAVLMAASAAAWAQGAPQEPGRNSGSLQSVSWDLWLAAKAKAEEYDAGGNLVGALQYYLEYTRQARGLNSPVRVAWGKNNAAYMIIKMHRQDPTIDLVPARKLLEEGLAVPEATEDCRRLMTMNLEHVRICLGRTH
jgi:hypothetical protein